MQPINFTNNLHEVNSYSSDGDLSDDDLSDSEEIVIPRQAPSNRNDTQDRREPLPQNTTRVNIQRRPQNANDQKLTIYNGHGDSARHAVVDDVKQAKIQKVYDKLKKQLLPDAYNVHFQLSSMTVRFEHNRTQYVRDLQEMVEVNPAYLKTCNKLESLVTGIWGGPIRNQPIKSGCKSSSDYQAMDHTHPIIKKLPQAYSDCAQLALELYSKKVPDVAKQDVALKRITAMEVMVHKQLDSIGLQLARKQDELTNKKAALEVEQAKWKIADAAAKGAIKADIDRLDAEIQALELEIKKLKEASKFDRLGFYVAVAFVPDLNSITPKDHIAAVEQAIEDAQEVLQSHIDSIHEKEVNKNVNKDWPELTPNFIRGEPLSIIENTSYSKRNAARIISCLPIDDARRVASKKASQEKDGIEDDLIRFVFDKSVSVKAMPHLTALNQATPTPIQQGVEASITQARNLIQDQNPLQGVDLVDKITQLNTAHTFT